MYPLYVAAKPLKLLNMKQLLIIVCIFICNNVISAQRSTNCEYKDVMRPTDGLITRMINNKHKKEHARKAAQRVLPAHCFAYHAAKQLKRRKYEANKM